MNEAQKKTSNGFSNSDSPNSNSTVGRILSEQHITSVPMRGVGVVKGTDTIDQFVKVYHWTVRFKKVEMTKREASILLKVLSVEYITQGLDFTGYIAVDFLTSYLLAGKLDPLDIVDEKDRQSCLLGLLIIGSFRGQFLTMATRYKLPQNVINEILESKWLPDTRTFNSWRQYHNARTHLEILAVPLDDYDNDQIRYGTRYSSYTKHYGLGGHVSRIQKTAYTTELDGENTDREPPEYSLLEIETYNRILWQIEIAKRIATRT